MSQIKNFIAVTEEIKATMVFLQDIGYWGFDCSKESLDMIKKWGKKIPPSPPLRKGGNSEALRKGGSSGALRKGGSSLPKSARSALPAKAAYEPPLKKAPPTPPSQKIRTDVQHESRETLSAKPAYEPPLKKESPPAPPQKIKADVQRESGETLDAIRRDIGDCRRCRLSKTRKRIVFGAGNPHARLVFVGEGPGYDEDLSGEPFVGEAGQLLTKIILAMKLTREEVYICNVIKCRPPGNRNPEADEIKTCAPFLKRQIAAVKPEFVCALGTFAAQNLLKTAEPISRLRGKFYDYKGIQVMPTFHPAYLLRNPSKKREVWEDVQKVMRGLGIMDNG
jgi:DNA polymerase